MGGKRNFCAIVTAITTVLLSACASGSSGYMEKGTFNILEKIAPAPRPGEPRYELDRRVFGETRPVLDTPRGSIAKNDVRQSPEAMLKDFSCALGISVTPAMTPATMNFLARAVTDTSANTRIAKRYYKRKRPFKIDNGPVCQSKFLLGFTSDYPSGHTTRGWTWAVLLARLVPERREQILMRGIAYGESRAFCGAHNLSAVDGGMASAEATLSEVNTGSPFAADFQTAKEELDLLFNNRGTQRPSAAACEIEAKILSQRLPRD
jgi:acid phosphatase (class A)